MKLPSVYANKIDKVIKNNTEYYKEDRNSKVVDLSKLRGMFDNKGFANKLEVFIDTGDGLRLEKLVLCKVNYFVNINNKKIYFKDIVNYEIKK